MKNILWHLKSLLALLTLASLCGLATAQTVPQDNDTTRAELANFDRFMDSHPEIAEQLRRDPSLVRNEEFVEKHPALQEYLHQHTEVREEISENPDRLMHQERRFDRVEDRRDNDTTRGELASFDRFMDGHHEIAEPLRKDPSLVKNEDFVRNHPDLREYLQQHPGVREEISENPDRFMHQEQRFDRAEDRRDNDTTRGELANFDRFVDGHHEIAEQLRKNPSLVKNEDFVRNHPDLQEYLQQHPGVREEISENPDRFMHQEQRFDRREDSADAERRERDRDRIRDEDRRDANWGDQDRDRGRDEDRRDMDSNRGELANFDRFTDSHPEIAEQLRKDPSLVRNKQFVDNHPALQEYLQQHPGVRNQLAEDPGRFMRQEQRFDRHEDARNGEMTGFGQFLGSHSSIAQELSKDPRLANDEGYKRNHPELQQYLKTHPAVQAQLKQNPQTYMKSAQPMGSNPVAPKSPSVEPMPKQ